MRKTIVGFALCSLFLMLGPPANAQPSGKTPLIGVLYSGSKASGESPLRAFRQGLRDLGYVEGKTLIIEYRYGLAKPDHLPKLANELIKSSPDIVVTAGSAGIDALKRSTNKIPIVVAAIGDAVGRGYVQSLSRPGGNVTGISFLDTEISTKRLEILKDVLPRLSHVVVLRHPNSHATALREVRTAAQALKLRLEVLAARNPDELEAVFITAKKNGAQAVNVLASPIFFAHRQALVDLAAKHRLPAAYEFAEFVEDGGLMSYAASLPEMWRRAATYVDKILKGAKPGDLPVEQPTKFELVINLKAAKQIGLTIPPNVLARADKVIR